MNDAASSSDADRMQIEAVVHGYVQGVYFRQYTRQRALELGVKGYVENLADGTVHVVAQGNKESLENLVRWLHAGPRAAEVERVEVCWGPVRAPYHGFEVH